MVDVLAITPVPSFFSSVFMAVEEIGFSSVFADISLAGSAGIGSGTLLVSTSSGSDTLTDSVSAGASTAVSTAISVTGSAGCVGS